MISDDEIERMLAAAKKAAASAYCPYSRFPVGAAVLSGAGVIHAGCNVENASYGLTACAERNAIFHLVASGEPPQIRAVLIYTPTTTPTVPCGACRQVLNEFGPSCKVVCRCDGPDEIRTSLSRLLPEAFGPHNLG
jgi:cytidine deaminase